MTRAVYRDQARVLILDEPTAALDPVAEAELYRQFSTLTGTKTTIFISHRLGITNVVERILVFDNGRIVEDGSHSELIKKNGKYAEMFHAQAQWYVA
jgi:ABC-type multidrug transport system fused ATPase/permease subunit